ncbi:MAG: CDP-diacylglycerol--serine O-phosphatidyltransferase [Pseudomonadales bacterium]
MSDDHRLKAVPGRGGDDPIDVTESSDRIEADDSPESGEAKMRRRGIYLLPNLITTGALFAGFFAIVAGMNGDFVAAALAIIVAGLLDTADGRVARWTRTESQFGAEYDSLSDMVAFGVGPALVAFSWGLDTLGQAGWVATFVYMACAALRLARFNTKGDNKTFTGLASPAAAAIIACLVWAWADSGFGEPSQAAAVLMALIVVGVGLLMVSNFIYFSPKVLELKGRVPFITLVAVVLVFAVLFADPPRVLLLVALAYAASGPIQHFWRRRRRRIRQAAGGDATTVNDDTV